MGRPPLPVGSYGKIQIRQDVDNTYIARTVFRDWDGKSRQVRRYGKTGAAAERALKKALTERQGNAGPGVTGETKIRTLAEQWLTGIQESKRHSIGTKQHYANVTKLYVLPALGDLRLTEATVGTIDKALAVIKTRHGTGAAHSMKSVLSGMLGLAVRHDALRSNPVRDTSAMSKKSAKGRARALTPDEVNDITDRMRSDPRATTLDLADLVDWMLYTGCRIGEACATRPGVNSEGKPILDLDHGTWEINATIIRIDGQGLHIQQRTKSDAGWRILALPPGAVEMIRRRQTELRFRHPSGVIFTSPKAKTLRDPSNTPGDLRKVLDSFGYEWVTSHTFRKTVATRLDESGLSAREIADQLGHAQPSMTMNTYMGRSVVSSRAAEVLDR
jgi:integrase